MQQPNHTRASSSLPPNSSSLHPENTERCFQNIFPITCGFVMLRTQRQFKNEYDTCPHRLNRALIEALIEALIVP